MRQTWSAPTARCCVHKIQGDLIQPRPAWQHWRVYDTADPANRIPLVLKTSMVRPLNFLVQWNGGLYRTDRQTNLVMILHELPLLYWKFNKCNSSPFGLIQAFISLDKRTPCQSHQNHNKSKKCSLIHLLSHSSYCKNTVMKYNWI